MTEKQNNMSARASAACNFEPTAKQTKTIASNLKAAQAITTSNQFREGLWHEYRLEGINAGLNPTQARERAESRNGSARRHGRNGADWAWLVLSEPRSGGKANRQLRADPGWAMEKQQNPQMNRRRGASLFPFDFRSWNARGKQ